MTRHWKLGIGVCLAVCTAGLVVGIYVQRVERRRLVHAASVTRARAEKGDAKGQFDLASMYFYGKGVPQDYAEAARWCRKAAEQRGVSRLSCKRPGFVFGDGVWGRGQFPFPSLSL